MCCNVVGIGFIDPENVEPSFEKASKWLNLFQEPLEVKALEFGDEEPTRIIIKDVERTFTGEIFRERLTRVLTLLENEFGDYHQGLSFFVSFLSLFMKEEEIVAIARRLNSHKDFIPGYWRHEAVDFVRDAYVLDHLLKKYNPEVHHHLARQNIAPSTYPQKWFVALCVHVFPFDALFAFFDRFFAKGVRFLFQFGLGFFQVIGPKILATDNTAIIYAYLRLDKTIAEFDDEVYMQIIEAADKFTSIPEVDTDDNLSSIRKLMYDTHLGKRFEAVSASNAKAQEEDDEFDWDEDGEAEPGSECEVCLNMAPDYWCFDCFKFVCGMCNDKNREPHKKSHKMCAVNAAPPEAYEPRTVTEDKEDSDQDFEDDAKSEGDVEKDDAKSETQKIEVSNVQEKAEEKTEAKSDEKTDEKKVDDDQVAALEKELEKTEL